MVVGILFYHWKTILVVGSKYGRNLIIGSSHSRWGSILAVGSHPTQFGPSDAHEIDRWSSDQIWTVKSM